MPPSSDGPQPHGEGEPPHDDETAFTIASARSGDLGADNPAPGTTTPGGEPPTSEGPSAGGDDAWPAGEASAAAGSGSAGSDAPSAGFDTPSVGTPFPSSGSSGAGSPPGGGSTGSGGGAGSGGDAGSGGSRSGRRRPPKPPGLGEQLSATFTALMRMARAHIDLARAEADEIKGEVARAAGLGGAAFAVLILLAFLLPIGLILFTGEWIFGSIGWGVLLGSELLVAVAVMLVLVALRVPRLGIDLLLAFVIGLIVAVVLGLNLPNQLWRAIGDAIDIGDPSWRPLAISVVIVAVIGALFGAIAGARARQDGATLDGLVAGFALGAWIGALLAISYSWRTGTAMGVAVGLLAWIVLMVAHVARDGIDGEALKARFVPQATIDTTKETIEWAKSKVPFGPKS